VGPEGLRDAALPFTAIARFFLASARRNAYLPANSFLRAKGLTSRQALFVWAVLKTS
jgi:hypothetical protein